MHTMERVLTQMLEYMRESLPLLQPDQGDLRKAYFALYYARLLELIDAALRLIGQTRDWAPTNVLLRSALECSIDLKNLSEQPGYAYVVRAMMLENRSALFHFKSQPVYGELVAEHGQEAVERMGQRAQNEFRTALKMATQYFPILKNAARNLSVLNRFRIAGQEARYQTEYTFLSMITHNDMAVMAIKEEVDQFVNSDTASDESAYNMCMRFMVDALKYKTAVFGKDDKLVEACLGCLDILKRKQERKARERSA